MTTADKVTATPGAISRDREAAKAWIDQARVDWDKGDVEGAASCCRRALALDSSNVDALANLGTLLWLEGRVEEGEARNFEAHAIDPGHLGAVLNLALLSHDAGDVETSLAWLRKAEKLRPRAADVIWRKGLLELALGDYANGWKHYEAGAGLPHIRGRGPGFRTPPWRGEACDRLVIWHEQGFGDTIQFVRYARLCRDRANSVCVLCPPELVRVLKTCPYVDAVFDAVDEGDFDQHVSIMSLPHLFGTTLQTIPAPIPYLHADPELVRRWSSRIRGNGLKVGLAWAGKLREADLRYRVSDRRRNLSLRAMEPLLDLPGIDFFSLQKGQPGSEAGGSRVHDFMDEVVDFADTAAIVANLDLVISVDTSVVHLTGALGKPVWVLSRLDACWRWLRNRADSPWYPTARVFGQTLRGDWSTVIGAVRNELRGVTASRTSS